VNFVQALAAALLWWHSMGVSLPGDCHPQLAAAVLDMYAYAYGLECFDPHIYLSQDAMRTASLNPYEYCATIVHEVGHLAGLPHPPTPERGNIMNDPGRNLWPKVPQCLPPKKGITWKKGVLRR
jgi:hypothetical protein